LVCVLALAAATSLSGCDRVKALLGGGKPSGQVVATVNGDEITSLQLRRELAGFSSRDPKVMKAAQQRALQSLIMRRLVEQEAKKQKLDKSVEYDLDVARAKSNILGQLYQRKIASSTAIPTRADGEAYIAAHPEKFANRKIFVLDQIVAASSKLKPDQVKAAKTMSDVESLLQQAGAPYEKTISTVDSLTADPRLVAAIQKIGSDDVFIVPQAGGALLFNHLMDTQAAPFVGDPAVKYAMNRVRAEKAQQEVSRRLTQIRKAADEHITYNDAYKPQPPAKSAPAKPAANGQAAPAPAPVPTPAK
jgi:EpsD family peptidyl-prolyl cis-trans isomerase